MIATGPSAANATVTLAALTLRRLVRGRAVWVSGAIVALPVIFAIAAARTLRAGELREWVFVAEQLVLAVLPALFVASSIAEEIEDKTTAYLWSRPLARWTILAGKLVALAPLAIGLVVASWLLAMVLGGQPSIDFATALALGGGALVCSLLAAAIATLVPKHGMALTICYLLFVDVPIGLIPASLAQLSITHHVRVLAGIGDLDGGNATSSIAALAIIGAVWSALALWRVRRLEA